MPVTDDQVALVRAYLTGSQGEFDRLQGELQETDVEPYFQLVSACFARAMKARLPRGDPHAAIIQLVGDLRAGSVQRAERIDPRRAERLIAQALGSEPVGERDEPALWTPLRLLRAMVIDHYLDQAELDDFLARARKLADLHLVRDDRGERTRSLSERALRADLSRDEASFQRLEDRFGPLDIAEHALLVMAALSVQLKQACPRGGTRIEIVELVGEIRAREKWWADSVRPLVAERIVRHLLHVDPLEGLDYLKTWGTARLLLRALVDDQWLDEAENGRVARQRPRARQPLDGTGRAVKRIKDRDVRAIRAHLHDRFGEVVRMALLTPFNRTFTVLGGAAFRLAAHRRFPPTYTHGDIVRFVAKARGHYRRFAGHVDPLLAEYVILQSIGGEVAGTYGRYRRAVAQLDLLRVLVEDLDLDDEGIEEILGQARALADEWLRNAKR